jgi:DNA-binding beta-propeller fold protein YncE
MVQPFLNGTRALVKSVLLAMLIVVIAIPAGAARKPKPAAEAPWPELLLEGGRKLTYQQTVSNEKEVRGGKAGFWTKLTDIVVGEPDFKQLVRPYSIATDSRGRMIISDPGANGVHIFDFKQKKYKFLDRGEMTKDPMIEPQCVAVDAKDNIYVTDSKAGKIFVFEPSGKYRGAFGSLKGGEGYFKRPTGIAIDSATQNVYVTDTLRDRVYVLDAKGSVLRYFGRHGGGDGEFNFPTEVQIKGETVAVVDAMNFRIELFDRNGNYVASIGTPGDPNGLIYRPKAVAFDSEDHIYLVEGESGTVEVFNRQGQLLYNFGNGTGFGRFQLPTGLAIDGNDRVYLVDSYNRRVQIFQYHALKNSAAGASR